MTATECKGMDKNARELPLVEGPQYTMWKFAVLSRKVQVRTLNEVHKLNDEPTLS